MYDFEEMYGGGIYADTSSLLGLIIIELIIIIILIVSMWKLFEKAGKPGWASLIPIYNTYIMTEIAGLPWWWLLIIYLGWIVPLLGVIASIVASIYVYVMFLKSYGKDTGFIILAVILPFIMLPIMAFSKTTEYIGPAGVKREGLEE